MTRVSSVGVLYIYAIFLVIKLSVINFQIKNYFNEIEQLF